MKHNFTPNHLILHMYEELLTSETLDLLEVMQEDENLQNVHQMLKEGVRLLPKAAFSPSDSTLQAILDYSARTAVATEC
jgi:hypothetical protein